MHTGEKPYLCEVSLFMSGEKSYSCKVCSRAYTKNSNLKNHHKIHNGEKPYACTRTVCSKEFTHSSDIVTHQKSL